MEFLNLTNIGLNYIHINDKAKPQYEMNLFLNLVEGHLDNTNLSTIKCKYNDEYLTNQFENLVQSKKGDWFFQPGPFMVVSPKQPVPPPKKTAKKRGGQKRNKKTRRTNI